MSLDIAQIKNILKLEMDKLIQQARGPLGQAKRVALDQAWKILQLAIANTIQEIEKSASELGGKDKKLIAMELLSRFYDSVFTVIDIPFVPPIFESIIHKYVKSVLMILVSSTIDAMVATFRNAGIFVDPSVKVNVLVDIKPRVSDK